MTTSPPSPPGRTFRLDAGQTMKLKQWEDEHDCPIAYQGAIGGKITYKFTPTGVGMAEGAECACGAKINVTDYESW